jgi:rSAM/selenodomain-associated transferase 1
MMHQLAINIKTAGDKHTMYALRFSVLAVKKALIIFVRQPLLGKVKTRLASTMGEAKALAIYKELLQHTRNITLTLPCDKFVFYADGIAEDDIWNNAIYLKKVQSSGDLGARMQAAFEDSFSSGYQHICVIGSDCYELTTEIIQQAFEALQHDDVVIGPSADGGYYLLGLSRMQPSLFTNIAWSTGTVLQQTIAACIGASCTHKFLPLLHDIDDEHDWIRHRTKEAT